MTALGVVFGEGAGCHNKGNADQQDEDSGASTGSISGQDPGWVSSNGKDTGNLFLTVKIAGTVVRSPAYHSVTPTPTPQGNENGRRRSRRRSVDVEPVAAVPLSSPQLDKRLTDSLSADLTPAYCNATRIQLFSKENPCLAKAFGTQCGLAN